MAHSFDIVVIGAGAAGIAAGRRLRSAPHSFHIFEARDRIGGRALTVRAGGFPLDLGCGWLHSADRNPWAALADAEDFEIDRAEPSWRTQFADLGFSPGEQAEAMATWRAFEKRLREEAPPSDRAADALEPGNRWNAFIDALSGYMNGASLATLSVRDYLAYGDADSGVNWRLPQGYGALIAQAAADLPITLAAPVTLIDRSSRPLVLTTAAGTIFARCIIVAVPTPVIADGSLRFSPALDDKVEAANGLPLGLANKLFLALDGAEEIDPDSHLIGKPKSAETASYYLRPFGRPMIEAFFGGSGADLLEREGPGAMEAFAVDELADLFGSSMRRRLRPLAGSRWRNEAWIGGGYSHALPGSSGARADLARSVEHRIFFAGEACSPTDFSTAHGAFASGVAAADAAIAALAGTEPAADDQS